MLRRIYDTMGIIEKSTAVLLLCAMGVVVFLQVFTRYVLNDSIGWTEEVARYLMIGLRFGVRRLPFGMARSCGLKYWTSHWVRIFQFGLNGSSSCPPICSVLDGCPFLATSWSAAHGAQ